MRLRLLFALAVLALPLASFQAAAQGGDATITISLSGPATATVNAGQSHSANFAGFVEISGIQCTQPGSIELTAALSNAGAAPAGVTPTVEPANITVEIPQGSHGAIVPGLPPLGPAVNQSISVTLRVATTAAASGVLPATVAVSFAGGSAGQGCLNNVPAASGTANHQVTIVGGASGGNGTSPPGTTPPTGGNGTGNNTAPPPAAPPRTPGFEPLVLAGALAVVAVAVRRRKA